MSIQKISRFPIPDINTLPEDIKKTMYEISEKSGFIPNIFLALSYRPDEFRAFFSYHEAIMKRVSSITKAEKEMIVVVTSARNNCLYCVIAHGAILRIYSKSSKISDQLATNYLKSDITQKQKHMLKFALKVCNNSDNINELDYQELREFGFSDDDIWDISAITSFFALSNRIANVISIPPNEDFYNFGRKV